MKAARSVAAGATGLVIGYYALLLGGAVARFGALPDYIRLHDWPQNVWSVLTGFPTLEQAIPVALREPLLEVGHSVPDLPMAEWSVQVLPPNLVIVTLVAALLAIHWRLARNHCHPGGAILAAGGSVATALTSASLSWIACCAAPSWIVILAMLGLWIPTALSLEQYGPLAAATGLISLVLGLVLQIGAHRIRR